MHQYCSGHSWIEYATLAQFRKNKNLCFSNPQRLLSLPSIFTPMARSMKKSLYYLTGYVTYQIAKGFMIVLINRKFRREFKLNFVSVYRERILEFDQYNKLVRIMTQFLTPLMLLALIFRHKLWDLQFKGDSEGKIFEKLFIANLFILKVFV